MLEEPDITRSIEDQQFIAEIESALEDDLRAADIFAEVIWHEQSNEIYKFRFIADSKLTSLEAIAEALEASNPLSAALGVSKPYKVGEDLIVWVRRTSPGPLYLSGSDEEELFSSD